MASSPRFLASTLLAVAACSSPTPPAEAPARPAEATSAAAPAAAAPEQDAPPTAAPSAPAAPAREPRPALSSSPEGVQPLSDEEKKTLKNACGAFTKAVEKAAKALGKPSLEAVLEVLRAPPSPAGVDGPACAGLMQRDMIVYRARTLESEALLGLKRFAVGVVSAAESDKKEHCPSAPPVPKEIAILKNGPFTSTPADYASPGYRCAHFDMPTPQHFQYELETDEKAGTFRVIARGFPVEGQGPEELFLGGRFEAGMEVLAGEILRR